MVIKNKNWLKKFKKQGDKLNVYNKIIKDINFEKVAPQTRGSYILQNLLKVCTKFWGTKSKNGLVIKKLKLIFLSPISNEEICNNIHSYYKRIDRR